MQAYPTAQLPQLLAEFFHTGLDRTSLMEAGTVFQIQTIGAGILRNHQQFLHTGFNQPLRFIQHLSNRTGNQITAQ